MPLPSPDREQQLRAVTRYHLRSVEVPLESDVDNLTLINAVRSYLNLELLEAEGVEDFIDYVPINLIEILDEVGAPTLDPDTVSVSRVSEELQKFIR